MNGGSMYQILQVSNGTGDVPLHVSAGDQITISAYQGSRTGLDSRPVGFQISLWAGAAGTGTLLGASEVFGDPTPVDTWTLRTYTYTATSAAVGSDIYLQLACAAGYTQQVKLDDVSGTYTATPEPSAIVLIVTGLLGLLAYARRKRN
jgi:hypothetical protein